MKKYMTLFTLLAVFFIGSYSASSQEVDKNTNKDQNVMKKSVRNEARTDALPSEEVKKMQLKNAALTPEDVAKKQTKNLQQLLSLDEKQTSVVYDICHSIEQQMNKVTASLDGDKKMSEINKLEVVKTEKLKEILTEDQFKVYLKSINNQR